MVEATLKAKLKPKNDKKLTLVLKKAKNREKGKNLLKNKQT
jgi:hypothetical protein